MKPVKNTIKSYVVLEDAKVWPMAQGKIVIVIDERGGQVYYQYAQKPYGDIFTHEKAFFYDSVRPSS